MGELTQVWAFHSQHYGIFYMPDHVEMRRLMDAEAAHLAEETKIRLSYDLQKAAIRLAARQEEHDPISSESALSTLRFMCFGYASAHDPQHVELVAIIYGSRMWQHIVNEADRLRRFGYIHSW